MSDQDAPRAATDPFSAGPLGGEEARHVLRLAAEQAERGEYGAAAGLYSRLVGNREPLVHVAALLGLADSRYRLDDEEGALQSWIVATQAPETPITWQAWVALAGARVRQGDLPAAARAYREAERRAPEYERPAISSRLGWLNKEMGNSQTAQRYFGRARPGVFQPVATWAILAVTIAVSVWTFIAPTDELLRLLLLNKQLVGEGEVWRLLTVTLVHGSPIHLAFNMYALFIVGPIVEALYGRVLYVCFYLLAAAGGSVASYLFVANPSVGASGGVFGLFGLLLLSNFIHRPALGRQAQALTMQIGFLIVLNLAIGFGIGGAILGGQIDNAAHVGGLLAGAWLGFAVAPRTATRLIGSGNTGVLRAAALIALLAVILVGLSITPLWA
jgi:membrane associated rhomboid family serine protease